MPSPTLRPTVRSHGSWESPIAATMLTQTGVRLAQPSLFEGSCYWLESRPEQAGRTVLVREHPNGPVDIGPADINIGSRVNEYGGGAYCLARLADEPTLFFVDAADQQIYCYQIQSAQLSALSQCPQARFADLLFHPELNWIIAIEELAEADTSCQRLVSFDVQTGERKVLTEGHDFYASPALSPDGEQLSWISWDQPNMPWDHNQCWLARIDSCGLSQIQQISPPESASFQPQWSQEGRLLLVNDASGWWNLCEWQTDSLCNLLPMEAEFATPQWQFGMSCYGFLDTDTLLAFYTREGVWHAGSYQLNTGQWQPLNWPYSQLSGLACGQGQAVFLAASSHQCEAVIRWRHKDFSRLKASLAINLPDELIARPTPVAFDTGENERAYGFYYAPTNPAFRAPAGELPPLIVLCHGGPTGATQAALNIKIQYWTSRGFAVMDVNYRGSTGYGRHYRNRLQGHWGLRDVEDLCSAARYAVARGWADADKLIIKGSSAGGYSVLAALAFHDTFKAGTSLYGIGDLTMLAEDTHRFEARYLDGLVAPWPEGKRIYQARSPLHCPQNIQCPVIFFQGLQDKVVPPEQAVAMHKALAEQGICTALITFEQEAHGFRQAQSIVDQLELELNFYGEVFCLEVSPARPDLKNYLSNPYTPSE